MRKILIISLASLISIGCGGAAQQTPTVTTINSNQTTNNAPVVQSSNVSTVPPAGNQAVVSSHSNTAEKPAAPPSESLTSTQSPMARPIDVNSMTADIEKAEKEYKKNPAAKDDLAKAYFTRATALTEAAQYPAALGDYRKGLRLCESSKH